MTLRRLFVSLLSVGAVLTLLSLALAAQSANEARLAAQKEASAAALLRVARLLLSHTYEYAMHESETSATQWQQRHLQARRMIDALAPEHPQFAASVDEEVSFLADVFARLRNLDGSNDDAEFVQQRKELLIDHMINDVHAILDSTYGWHQTLGPRVDAAEHRLARIAVFTPILLLTGVAVLAFIVSLRVLQPVDRLRKRMVTVDGRQHISHHEDNRPDEIGDLVRAFNAMGAALDRVRNELEQREVLMRNLTDHLPVQVGRLDSKGRYVFVNAAGQAAARSALGEGLLGHTLRDQFGAAIYETVIAPRIRTAMLGEPARFVFEQPSADGNRHNDLSLVPEFSKAGELTGLLTLLLDVTETRRHQQSLEAALAEKEVLLREVHHRVKNNLQVVSSLLALQASQSSTATARAALEESRERIQTMALLHEALYQHGRFSGVGFGDFLTRLVTMLEAAYGRPEVRIQLRVDHVEVPLDLAVPAALMANELVSNAFKHAFPSGRRGCITVQLERLPHDCLCLKVADNGVGVSSGVSAAPSSLGMRLVHLLAGQLDARTHIQSEQGYSTSITFSLYPTNRSDERPLEREQHHV